MATRPQPQPDRIDPISPPEILPDEPTLPETAPAESPEIDPDKIEPDNQPDEWPDDPDNDEWPDDRALKSPEATPWATLFLRETC